VETPSNFKDYTNQSRQKIANLLFYFAWFIEILAVATGLAITGLVATDTYYKNLEIVGGDIVAIPNVAIAALPFFMVSIVELAKIPTAIAFYITESIKWKWVFGVTLTFLAIVTFETAMNGFERNFRNLNYTVNQLSIEKESLISKKATLIEQNKIDKSKTREMVLTEFDRQNNVIKQRRDDALKSFSDQKSLINAKSNNIQVQIMQEKIRDLKGNTSKLAKERDQRIDEINRSAGDRRNKALVQTEKKRDALEQEKRSLETRLRNLKQQFKVDLENANFFFKTPVRNQYEPQISILNDQLSSITSRLINFSSTKEAEKELTNSGSEVIGKIRDEYDQRIASIYRQIEEQTSQLLRKAGVTQKDIEEAEKELNVRRERIQDTYENDLQVLAERRDQDLEVVKDREKRISSNEAEMRKLDGQVIEIKSKINKEARDNQVYRIAKMFDSKAQTIADVEQRLVNLVGKIWFGSLALVIAITGILLALASEVVKGERFINHSQRNPLTRSVRSLALAINRRVRQKPKKSILVKEVVKEVPVDKVVFKDVVKEVVKKEVVHVPIYTTDKSLLEKQDD